MEVREMPKSSFTQSILKYEYGLVELLKGEYYFTPAMTRKKKKVSKDQLETTNGRRFDISKLRSNVKVQCRVKGEEIYDTFMVETSGVELDGKPLRKGMIVVLKEPTPIIYNSRAKYSAECDIYEKPNFNEAIKEAKRMKKGNRDEEEVVSKKAKFEKEREERAKVDTRAWNDSVRKKDELSDAKWNVAQEIVKRDRGMNKRVGFVIRELDRNGSILQEKEINLNQAKDMCYDKKIKNMTVVTGEDGEEFFRGVGGFKIENLPQILQV